MHNSQKRSARYRNRRRQLTNSRQLTTESLEDRVLLAGDTSLAWHNVGLPMDANQNGVISASDALTVIRELNDRGARELDDATPANGLVDINADGFVSPSDGLRIIKYLNSGSGEGDELVRLRLDVTSRDSLDSLSTLSTNQDFFLRVYATDLTADPQGVFAAYLDIDYTAELADAEGTIEFSPEYQDGPSGEFIQDGVIDELGAFAFREPSDGAEELLVLSVPLRTESETGSLTFAGNPPDVLPNHEVLLWVDPNLEVPGDLILFDDITVQVQVEGAPTPIDDAYATDEDTTLNVTAANGVLANDSTPTGTLSATVVTGPTNGALTLNADGSFDYVPDDEFSGSDSFTYSASNGTLSSEATVSLTVNTINDAPVAVDDTFRTQRNTVLDQTGPDAGVLANDTDVDSTGLTVVVNQTQGPANGQLSITPNGQFTYTPNVDFSGSDSFTYVITDGTTESEPATVTLNVGGDEPNGVADNYLAATNGTLTVGVPEGVLANDTDPNGATLFAAVVAEPTNGTIVFERDGSFVYTPDADFEGTDTFQYVAFNVALSSPATTVTIDVSRMNQNAPVALSNQYGVDEDQVLTINADTGVLANDSDADGDTLTASILTQPLNGSLSLNQDGSFVYTPNPDFNGSDLFTYRASDGERFSNSATVSILVAAVQDAPTVVNDSYDVEIGVTRDVTSVDGVLANDSDRDGDPLTVSVDQGPQNGTLALASDGSFQYTPDAGFSGADSFTYTATDGTSSQVGTVSLNVAQAGPLVAISLLTTDLSGSPISSIDAGQPFLLQVFVEDTSPEPQEGVFAAYTDVEWAASQAVVNGTITYNDTYSDGQKGDTTTPGLIDELGAFSRDETGVAGPVRLASIPMLSTGSGVVTFSTNPADVLPFGDVLLFDTALNDRVASEDVSYGTASLTILGRTVPIAVPDSYDADDGAISINAAEGVLANDLPVDGQPLTAALVASPANGTVDLNDDGSFTYTADAGFVGEDTFTYQAVSGTSSEPVVVSINVGNPDPGSVTGSVYFDTNNNGIFESTEHAFGGLAVTLTGTDIFGNVVTQQSVTAPNGSYRFDELSAGSYTITQEKPEIVIDGKDTLNGVDLGSNDQFEITLEPGQQLSGLNFGERGLMPQFIRSSMFLSSRVPEGVGIGIGADGNTSWYCSDAGWSDLRDIRASLSADGSSVSVTAVDNLGQTVGGTFTTANANVRVLGNATDGYFVRMIGSSASFPMAPLAANAAAIDAVFGS